MQHTKKKKKVFARAPYTKTSTILSVDATVRVVMGFSQENKLSPISERYVEAIGVSYLAHARRKALNRTFSEDERIEYAAQMEARDAEAGIEDADSEEDEITDDMINRDPKDWKDQDHYIVLGLSSKRWMASEDDIKRAHHKQALKYHPDKRDGADGFFKCIQKAYEQLSDPIRRRQFDSVDKAADIDAPHITTKSLTKPGGEEKYYEAYNLYFSAFSRFSKTKPVPMFGDASSTRNDVEEFYNFWYNFESWRTFEYLDDDTIDSEYSRDEKRYRERKNKAERARYKKEDSQTLRETIDEAFALDPRIRRFKEAEKEAKRLKAEQRKQKETAAKQASIAKIDTKTKKGAASTPNVPANSAPKQSAEEKKAKEDKKKAIKKDKKTIKTAAKNTNYFLDEGVVADAKAIDAALDDVDLLIQKAGDNLLSEFAKDIESSKVSTDVFKTWAAKLSSDGPLPLKVIKLD